MTFAGGDQVDRGGPVCRGGGDHGGDPLDRVAFRAQDGLNERAFDSLSFGRFGTGSRIRGHVEDCTGLARESHESTPPGVRVGTVG